MLACVLSTIAVAALGQEATPTGRLDAAAAAAEAGLRRGELAAAERLYADVLLEGWILKGWLDAAEGRLERAHEAFTRASTEAGDARRALEARAVVDLQMGRVEDAIEGLARLVEREPKNVALRRFLAQAQLIAGHAGRAVAELETARALEPDDLELAFALATAYLADHRQEDAERAFDVLRKARPIPQTRILIGRAYRDVADYERARAEFRAALAQDPRTRRAHYYLGMVLLMNEGVSRVDDAVAEFRRELEVSPDDPTTHLFLGGALVVAGRHQEALSSLELATRSLAAPARAFFYLGRCLLALGRPAEAAQALRGALDRSQASPETSLIQGIHHQLGLALRTVGDVQAAAVHFAEAQRLSARKTERERAEFAGQPEETPFSEDPRPALDAALVPSPVAGLAAGERAILRGAATEALARAYVNIGVLDIQGRRFERAADRFGAAVALDPEFPQAQYFLGVARFNAGQFEKAAESLERARMSRPEDTDARRMLAIAWLNSGAYTKVVGLLRDDPRRAGDSSLQLAYLFALVRSGGAAEAVSDIEAAAQAQPDSREIHSLLAEAYRALGRMEDARRELEIARRLNGPGRP
jgi:tetratricopeptide (TPR) repeat protein